ncbi:Nnf1-domain-containing protein [Poronia punctata]|nr:Nnf1-domain-containing protein [Poronia punctata]
MAPDPEPSTNPPSQSPSQSQSQSQPQPQPQAQGDNITTAGNEGEGGPPPPPRRAAAPLKPGPRASRFQATLDSALSHTLGKVSWDNFAACFPTMAAKAPAVLRAVQTQMVDRLRSLCQKEFDSIQQARDVVARLNELDALVNDADRRRREAGNGEPLIPPHLLPPEDVLAAHLAPHLAQQQSQLNAKLQTVQAHNANLFEDIKRQRSEIESLVAILEKVLEDVENANHMMDGVVDVLARETRAIEVEMIDT